ncbi:MAG TPA: alanyl-tRNA editing protein [Herpetosiphonaceae bacterium]
MQTRTLYATDSAIRECAATVLAVQGNEVALDETAFYPGGGGQPHDTGTLEADGQVWKVISVRKDDQYVWHTLEGENMPSVGQRVRARLDWDRRYLLMRIHSALHVLSAVAYRDYGASVTGGNMTPGEGHLDFEIQNFTPELAQEMIGKANQEIERNRPVRVYFLPRDEAFKLPDLIRTKTNLVPEGVAEVRIVEIEELDRQADGGTHVGNTSEIGPVTLVKTRSKGATNKRIVIGIQP